jgi:malonyl-CoA/methylmalonyl-CoA synthetase
MCQKVEDCMPVQSLGDCFAEAFSAYKDRRAITFFRDGKMETELSYWQLHEDTNRMANTFLAMGIQKGDRVLLVMEKSLIFVIAHVALQRAGAVTVPLNPGFKKSELEYLLHDADGKMILTEKRKETLIRRIDPDLPKVVIDSQRPYHAIDMFRRASKDFTPAVTRPDDPGLIIYTSGTTGKPKGAILTQKNLVHDARNIIRIWEISDRDVLCHALPLFHVHGLCFALHTSLLAGAHVLMLDQFAPRTVIAALSQQEGPCACTVFMAVPAMYTRMIEYLGDRKGDFGHVRLWTSGSAPLPARDFERMVRAFGREPVEREGMSETGMNFSNPLRGKRKPGSIGVPLPALEVRIVDPATGKDVNPGQTGEIWLKGPSVTPGYWRHPQDTARAFEQGWFKTGDLGKMDEDGYYYLTDRIKHIIISGGENISPKEVEAVINRIEGVRECSVVGLPDKKWGEKVAVAVAKNPDVDVRSEDVLAACKEHLHDWKCPKEIAFVKELPRNTMGKVLREKIKDLF